MSSECQGSYAKHHSPSRCPLCDGHFPQELASTLATAMCEVGGQMTAHEFAKWLDGANNAGD